MKKTGVSKLIAAVSALAILTSQFTAFAKLSLTANMDIMNGATREIPGFRMDSKNYSMNEWGDNHSTYGEYQQNLRWNDNLINKGWNAGDSMNIYPIGTPDTDYFSINSPQTFTEAPYASYGGSDVTVWNGYMFVVMQDTVCDQEDYTDWDGSIKQRDSYVREFKSIIQVYDISNGKKEHVATWDAADMDFGGTEEGLSHGIRQIAVTDTNIFMLVDMCSPNWNYKFLYGDELGKPVTTYGCGLAIFENNISREDGTYDLPTRSAMQSEAAAGSDREKFGVDQQWRLMARGNGDGGELYVRGDYLVYIPQLFLNNMAQGTDTSDDVWKGIHIVKWNDSEREATEEIRFEAYTFLDWLDYSFPADYGATEYPKRGDEPDVGALVIEGDYMYIDVVYTAPTGAGGAYEQYDQVMVVDMSDVLNPVVVGTSAPIKSLSGEWNLYRKMGVSDGFVYFGYRHWFQNWGGVPYDPYLVIVDVRNMQSPRLATTIKLRDYGFEHDESNYDLPKFVFGVDAVTAIGDIVIVQMDLQTLFFEMSEDRTRILDHFYARNAMTWGALSFSGNYQPFVYGDRIFYPQMSGEVNRPNEDGTWPDPATDGQEFRYLNRIEVIDFSAAMPKNIQVDNIRDNDNGTYTISGTVQGVEVTPALYDLVAISVTNTNTRQNVGEIYFADLETEIDAEEDVAGWSYVTDESTPANITFTLNNEYEEAIPGVYENVKLSISGGSGGEDIPDSTIDTDDLRIFVDFEQDYLDYENYFTVWGEYTGDDTETIQIMAALYDGEGKLEQFQVGEPEYLWPEEPFSIDGDFFLESGIEPEADSVLKVFVWSGTGGIRPLGQAFRQSGAIFTYTLDDTAQTSAGVFDADGTLIRTLWGNVTEEAGEHTKVWDGLDDNGVMRQDGEYTITVMENNVEVEVDAFIGNTSDHSDYNYIMSAYQNYLSDMMYVNGNVFFIYPYSEGRQAIYYFNASNPDRKAGEFGGTNICMQRAVTDGTRMYLLNTEPQANKTFVYAFDLNSRRMYDFAGQGTWTTSFWGTQNAYCAINMVQHGDVFQTGGIGVQRNGDKLFASYVSEGKVYVLSKNDGHLYRSYNFNTPRALAYNDNGGLWIGYKKNDGRYIAERYNVGADGSLSKDNSIALEHDFGYLLHLELSPDGKRIVAADGQTNQYKMYSTETGKLLWTFGSGESYKDDPTIHPDKLMLKYTGNERDLVYSEFENDNTLWVCDAGNNRSYKLNLSKGYPEIIDMIMTQPGSHSLGLDATDPTTVFSNAIEYKMDYRKSGAESWEAVKNWKQQVDEFGIHVITWNQFNNMITLNGKRYFSAWHDNACKLFCFEKNYIRDTGINFNDKIMLDDGRVGSILPDNGRAIYRVHNITGYNHMGDPIYDNGTIVANLPSDWHEPIHAFGAMKLNMPITENNIMMTLRCVQMPDTSDRKTWHVGGVKIGDGVATDWQWKVAPEGSNFYDGNFPTDGTFEGGNGVVNTAQKVVTNGRNVVFQYNGEFYKNKQTNKLYFYRDNGLLVGVFGEAGIQRQTNENRYEYGKEIYPGNAFDMYFVQDPEDTNRAYIVQNNENGFGNFKYNVTGLDTIKEHTMTVELKQKATLWEGLQYRYYVGDPSDAANLVTKSWRGTVAAEPYETGDNFVMRYTGYLKNPNRSGNLRLYVNAKDNVTLTVNGQQLVNGAGSHTPQIYMKEGELYSFTCEVRPSASTSGNETRVVLGYYDNQGTLQTFAQKDFRTEKLPYQEPYTVTVDLLEGLPFSEAIANGQYGITRDTSVDVSGVGVYTNSTNDSFDEVRDIRFECSLWPHEGGWWPTSGWMAKNLGKARDDMYAWEIDMDVARSGYLNYGNQLGDPSQSTGVHIDVLDEYDRVIARFYWAKENKTYGNNQFLYQATDLYDNNLNHELYNVPGSYDNQFFNPSPLKISGNNGTITFEYYNSRVSAQVLDPAAQWDKPAKLKIDAFFNYGQTQAREMDVSITRLDYTQYLY